MSWASPRGARCMPTRSGAPDRDDGVRHFQHQPGAVLDRAAVGVGALVAAVLQELVEQIAVGAMHLDAVEAGGLGVLGALAIGLDDAGDFVESPARAASTKGASGRSRLTWPLGAMALGATGSAPSR